MYDVIIVGAGPAGLNAALILGRCRRRVLVCDAGKPRNAASRALHGFLTRDGTAPRELLRLGREELHPYDTVEVRSAVVVDARCAKKTFEVVLDGGERLHSRKLLLATGVVDLLPQIEGFSEHYGRSVFHCPYCDGWEFRDRPLAIYGRGASGLGASLTLTTWSRDLMLCTDGPGELSDDDLRQLGALDIPVRQERIARLEGKDGMLERIVFASGESVDRSALFFSTGQIQPSPLAEKLGCVFTAKGAVDTGDYETTNVYGLYVAGDASVLAQLVIVAAGEGAKAGIAINTALQNEDLHLLLEPTRAES